MSADKKDYTNLNFYEILGVNREASIEDIRVAYREAIWQNHPDRNTHEFAHELTQQLNKAYDILSNKDSRARYDFTLNYPNMDSQNPNNDAVSTQTDIDAQQAKAHLDAERFKANEEKRKIRIEEEKARDKKIRIGVIIGILTLTLALSFGIWTYSKKYVTPQPVTDLAGRGIEQVPYGLENSNIVNVLYLHHNQLTELPPTIGTLSRLTHLTLAHNHLKTLPKEFYNLQTLAVLDLSDNDLVDISPLIFRLGNLQELSLQNNQLKSLPIEALQKLPNLKILKVSGNPFPKDYTTYMQEVLPNVAVE